LREKAAYIHAGQDQGAGGIPASGSSGGGLLLLSGGIDSPVAGYMMAKRGLAVEALHFESFPYTSEAARDKVMTLAKELCQYCGLIRVHVISLTHIQEVLRDTCEEDYFTLLLRRFMMKLATRQAEECEARVLITGESLGQVASQTLSALCVTDDAAGVPVFRPCIGMDKEEIIRISRSIGTYDTSILPYEDCCTVFTPRHPRTRPELSKVLAQESLVDVDALLDEAWASRYTVVQRQFDEAPKWKIEAK
jgi:thiamine biosynthesis protein ThiI